MSDTDDDLEDYWEAVQTQQLIKIVKDRATDLREQLEVASAKTAFEMTPVIAEMSGKMLGPEALAQMISKTVRVFMEKWYEGLRGQNLAGLLELVLEGQNLPLPELKGFVQALPVTMLERVVRSAVGSTGSGVHLILAMELHMRQRNITDYTLDREAGRLFIEFVDPKRDAHIKFFLDEVVEHLQE